MLKTFNVLIENDQNSLVCLVLFCEPFRLEYREYGAVRLPLLADLVFHGNPVRFIESGYFKSFPSLVRIYMSWNRFVLANVPNALFQTVLPLQQLSFTDNDFTDCIDAVRRAVFEATLTALNLPGPAQMPQLDLSNNHLIISAEAVALFPTISQVPGIVNFTPASSRTQNMNAV